MVNPTQESEEVRSPGSEVVEDASSGRASTERAAMPHREAPTLAEVAWMVVEHRWTFAVIAAVALLGTAAYLMVVAPVYRSSVLVQVEGGAMPAAPDDVVRLFDTAPRMEGEMRILQSRPLLGSVVDLLGLDVEAHARTVPIVGDVATRRYAGATPAPALLGQERFGWGGERIRLGELVVGRELIDERLSLVALEDGRYQLTTPDGLRLDGHVGTPASAGDGQDRVSLLVLELRARPGTEFVVRKLDHDEVVQALQKRLTVTQQGKDSGLVEVSFKGTDPERVARLVESLGAAYVRQSIREAAVRAAQALEVVEGQLPALKARADATDSALDRFHRRNQVPNLSVDAARLLTRIAEVEKSIGDAEALEREQSRRHGAGYPETTHPELQLAPLRQERAALEEQIRALPALELEHTRLMRDATLAKDRYLRVLDRVEALRTATSEWTGNARVVEHAVLPRRPVSPKPGLAIALALLVGVAGGAIAAMLRGAFDGGIRDPEDIEAGAGVPVLATVPRSASQERLARRAGRRGRIEALSVAHPGDMAVEDLRALRTGLEFTLRRGPNNVVVIGSPAPDAGKTFVSVNLAHLLSFDGRVLLMDGDLRRGLVHRYFGLEVEPGLSDVLLGHAALDAAVRRTDQQNLDVLPMGRPVTNQAELLASAAFRQLLETVRSRYKAVVVDSPPILSVTDSAVIARSAGTTLLVVREGAQNVREVSLSVKRYAQNGARVRGVVLNAVRATLGHYGRSGGYRRYDARYA